MAWLRLDENVPENDKAQTLPADLFRFWINILCVAKKTDGKITDLSRACFRLRMTEIRLISHLERLVTARLVEKIEGVYCLHDWDQWQYKCETSTERMRRHRERKKQRSRNKDHVTVESHVTSLVASKLQAVTENSSVSVSVSDSVLRKPLEKQTALAYDHRPAWEWFLENYPKHRVNEMQDCRLWLLVVEDAETAELIREKLPAFQRSAEWRRGVIPSARKWLSERMFLMEPPPEDGGSGPVRRKSATEERFERLEQM